MYPSHTVPDDFVLKVARQFSQAGKWPTAVDEPLLLAMTTVLKNQVCLLVHSKCPRRFRQTLNDARRMQPAWSKTLTGNPVYISACRLLHTGSHYVTQAGLELVETFCLSLSGI